LRDAAFGQQIVAFKVWDLTGLVLYSTDPVTAGHRFEMDEDLQRAARGYVSSSLSYLDEPENEAQRAISPRLLETNSPVRRSGTGQIIAIAEFYQTVDELEREMAAARSRSWLVVGGAMLFSYAFLTVFVSRMDQTIKGQQYALNNQVGQLTDLLEQHRALDDRVRRAARAPPMSMSVFFGASAPNCTTALSRNWPWRCCAWTMPWPRPSGATAPIQTCTTAGI
jgi:hypothetical protein